MNVLRLVTLNAVCLVAAAAEAEAEAPALADTDSNREACSMSSIDYSSVSVLEKELYAPPLEELAEVLSNGLKSTFETVKVSVVDCPDLTQPPYYLTSSGLSGNETLVEIGGVPNLVPTVHRDKIYDLAKMVQHVGRDSAFVTGAGAGPWSYLGVNCEGIINMSIRNGTVDQGTRIVSIAPVGAPKGQSSYLQQRLPDTETRTALLGNYLLTEGNPGKVLKIETKNRIGPLNYVTAIRETLKEIYGDRAVGLGGMFLLKSGRGKFHVMPDFSTTPLCSDSDVDNWLHYFEMNAPITVVGTLVSGDPGLDLRVQHFHGFSAHGDGGHYHYDTTPSNVEYDGYFVPAKSVLRIDQPVDTHSFGRD